MARKDVGNNDGGIPFQGRNRLIVLHRHLSTPNKTINDNKIIMKSSKPAGDRI